MWLILLKLRWCCPKFSLHLGVETVRCIACRKCALNRKSLFLIFCLNNRHSATLRRSYTRLSTKKVNRNPRRHRRVIWLSYIPPPALYLTVHITTSSTAYSFSSDLTQAFFVVAERTLRNVITLLLLLRPKKAYWFFFFCIVHIRFRSMYFTVVEKKLRTVVYYVISGDPLTTANFLVRYICTVLYHPYKSDVNDKIVSS